MIWIKSISKHSYQPERAIGSGVEVRKVAVFMLLVFLSSVFFAHAQQRKDLEGRVFSKDGDVAGTHVMNITTQKGTITKADGFFSIPVHLNDTLVFSAVQYKRKTVPVNLAVLESIFLNVFLVEGEIKLDEVLVMPYNLTGDLFKDLDSLKIGSSINASSLGLPNADVKSPTQSQRKLYTARTWDIKLVSVKLDPLINYFSGRTKMLKARVAREAAYNKIQDTKDLYVDSLFTQGLGIPKNRINDFMFFCEVDATFQPIVDSQDIFRIWEFMRIKSVVYRKNNDLD